MPLSEQEQRLLDEMERSLYGTHADVVQTRGARSARPNYRALAIGILVAVAGVGVLIAGAALHQMIIGVVGFLVMFGGVLLAIAPGKGLDIEPEDFAEPAARPSGRGFMDNLGDRWDRRKDEQG